MTVPIWRMESICCKKREELEEKEGGEGDEQEEGQKLFINLSVSFGMS